jgi:uncharacterized protein YbjT (DUF2867 family)
MRIVVLGGSGSLGQAVGSLARAAGHDAVPVSRRTGVDVVTGAGLGDALAGADVVIDATNALRGARDVLVTGTTRVVEAAHAAGARHVIAVSIVGIDDAPLGYYAVKRAQERVVEASPVPWTLVRATQFHDLIPRLAAGWLGIVLAPRGLRLQPIDVRDVAAVLVGAVAAGPAGRLPDVAGPEVVPYVELARRWTRAAGMRRLIVPVPMLGATGRFLRSGALCNPERAVGTTTFDAWLAERYGSA